MKECDLHLANELAALFKNAGYDIPCRCYHVQYADKTSSTTHDSKFLENWNSHNNRVSALSYDQAINWLLDNHNMYVEARYDEEGFWTTVISDLSNTFSDNNRVVAKVPSRREALSLGIGIVLTEILKIV